VLRLAHPQFRVVVPPEVRSGGGSQPSVARYDVMGINPLNKHSHFGQGLAGIAEFLPQRDRVVIGVFLTLETE
jgi:hypothetical protein